MAVPKQDADIKQKYSWDETIRTWFFALLLALVFRSLAFEPFHIPSGSMKSTLLVGDYLFVSKYSYGYSRYSFPFSLPLFSGRILESRLPQRGDVVVFREPSDPRVDFIKRIIGLPGDHIQLKDGIVYLNGAPLPRQPEGDFADAENPSNIRAIPRFAETLPGGKRFDILKERRYG
ncbi:MAG: signal peptidase I, partial [Pseudomonadota bacterium]|nr:signal peptidase I [Pseudomonadota bacterium]